ncbi:MULTISPECIES: Dyp-type peroxidase [Nocardiaceae]|uniref:Dyp-type peroxidase n=1 Tax=Rhodococcoides kroppenstedtii TaxID=293050 RepID=A0ABS7NUZ0_9NOCA|nr:MULTISPECIES: Dyp-type peroxidase [Rhodococcus]AMY20685.1 Dye-decolorizing peroxidase [Rhodococcus sp. PBTS 1]MBY6313344.1 Dyp-type peroxidase [Rhodococcus kroppenstedtii]MBY6321235.1 Dyp-type peroxidase [Rhodococcus kroppenstedtii]
MAGKNSRRSFLVGSAAAAAAAAAGLSVGRELAPDTAPEAATTAPSVQPTTVEFHGAHQPGIADPTPTHASFLSFDLAAETGRTQLTQTMQRWTAVASALASGDTSVDPSSVSSGSGPGMFTMTVGVGGGMLDRLGIARPEPLIDLPAFPGDRLDHDASYGDIFVQLCSNDAIYLSGAVRAVRRTAGDALVPRWQLNGFRGVAASTSSTNGRNLMGQVDGTNNIAVSRGSSGGAVWIDDPSPEWMQGGSYVVLRRIRMLLSEWESADGVTRDRTIGRHTSSGAPLGARDESDPVDLAAVDTSGTLTTPDDAHIRLAAPRRGAGEEMLRRSYSYSNGQIAGGTDEDAGLIFVSYQRDPRTSFVPVQRRLAESDALNRFTEATTSAIFAVLPGVVDDDDWYGRRLLG